LPISEELPGALVGLESAHFAIGSADGVARAGGASEVRTRLVDALYAARSRVGVGEGTVGLDRRYQLRNAVAELLRGLIEADIRRPGRYPRADGIGDLDAVVQIAVGVQGLQQDQLVGHTLVLGIGCVGS